LSRGAGGGGPAREAPLQRKLLKWESLAFRVAFPALTGTACPRLPLPIPDQLARQGNRSMTPPPCPRRTRPCLALLGVLALGTSSPAMAGTTLDTDADASVQATELDAIRVIGNAEDPQSSTGSAYVLSERELEKFDRGNINNVLRSVPGVYTREEAGEGVFPRISIRASSSGRSDRISVLEDGVPAAMAPY